LPRHLVDRVQCLRGCWPDRWPHGSVASASSIIGLKRYSMFVLIPDNCWNLENS
jgi:hypothetical protein